MSTLQLTSAQADAVNAVGGSVIVSAAAGSGKTRVLVERVKKRLTDTENPISADRLLIVTFTKAAAAEMKTRISKAIEELLIEDPDNMHLRRQQLLIPSADICTIHSFCTRILKENFFELKINKDFRIGSDSELTVIKKEILSDIIENRYSGENSSFRDMSVLLSGAKSDSGLEDTILRLYDCLCSYPFPSDWLSVITEMYDPDKKLTDTVFDMYSRDMLDPFLQLCDHLLSELDEIISSEPSLQGGLKTSADTKYDYLLDFVDSLKAAAKNNDRDALTRLVTCFEKKSYRRPAKKNLQIDDDTHKAVKNCFDTIDNMVQKKLLPVFAVSEEDFAEDNKQLYPIVMCMCSVLREFSDNYMDAKKERGILDFSDLEHLMLQLLYTESDGKRVKSQFAHSLSGQYDEVMVDEYQDTNEIQEMIFKAVSKDETNLFVVGDVKQSIYRFREANPGIFINRRNISVSYNREAPSFPSKIILDRNFRSREGIIDSVNFVFRSLMSERVGEIDYNDDEMLVKAADYPENDDIETELHFIEKAVNDSNDSDNETDEATVYELEAAYIAELIQKKVSSGEKVTENGVLRPVKYSDFCILMRNLSTHAHIYADTLTKYGVPAYTDKPYSLFECYEVRTVISFLKIVDNPLSDIPVLSVLTSPVFGFTPDELSIIKLDGKGKYFYSKLLSITKSESVSASLRQHCTEFSELISYFRAMSFTMPVDRLIDLFFEKTGYISVIGSMPYGQIRIGNLHKLTGFAHEYETNISGGLGGFVRYIKYLEESGTEISASGNVPDDSVSIMTIHHSKGLEFPICILAALSSKGDKRNPPVMFHSELGFGFSAMDESGIKYDTLQKNIIKARIESETKSEEMRVLYVAMTRAKEKLIPIISITSKKETGYSDYLNKIGAVLNVEDGRLSPYCVEDLDSFAKLITACALVHPDLSGLRSDAALPGLTTIPTRSRWKYRHSFVSLSDNSEQVKKNEQPAPIDPQLYALLDKRFGTTYKHIDRIGIPTKVSASALAHSDLTVFTTATSRPAFVQQDNMTGAEKGTAMHIFLQYADPAALKTDFLGEKKRLTDKGIITVKQADSIGDSDIEGFIKSDTYNCILNADKVLREYRFTVNINASDADPNITGDEIIILQGAMDCLLINKDGIIIIDYKTDSVKDPGVLAERYKKQLLLYKNAAEQLFEKKVTRCIIYSVHCSADIDLL